MTSPPIPEPAPPENRSRHRLVLAERSPPPPGPPWKFWARRGGRVFAFFALVGGTAALVGAIGVYYAFSEGLPEIPRVAAWAPPILTEVYTDDQVLAGEFYNERRKVVPYERIPKRLVQAFIASEDASFFDHPGVDVLGTAARGDQDGPQEVPPAPAACRAARRSRSRRRRRCSSPPRATRRRPSAAARPGSSARSARRSSRCRLEKALPRRRSSTST